MDEALVLADALEGTKPAAEATIKYKLYPTLQQWTQIRKAFGAAAFTYNKCVATLEKGLVEANKKDLRAYAVNSDSELVKVNAWLSNVPYDIRGGAVLDLLIARKGLFTKVKNDTIKSFKTKFRSRKQASQAIHLPHKHY